MNNERTLLTDDILKERKEILLRVIDAIDELTTSPGLPLSACLKEHNLDHLKTRSMLLRLSGCDTANCSTKIEVSKALENKIELCPEEEIYYNVFGCKVREWSSLQLPEDYKETARYVMEKVLNEREQYVLRLRYGFPEEGDVRITLDACGQHMGVTKQCVRQIEARAFRKMRKHPFVDILSYGLKKYNEQMDIEEKEREAKLNPTPENWRAISSNPKNILHSFLFLPVEDLSFSVRTHNCLLRNGITHVFDVFCYSPEDLSLLPWLGVRTQNEIMKAAYTFAAKCGIAYNDIHAFCCGLLIQYDIERTRGVSCAQELSTQWFLEDCK